MIEPAHHLANVPCQSCEADWVRLGDNSQVMDHEPGCAYMAWLDDVDDTRTYEQFLEDDDEATAEDFDEIFGDRDE